MAASDTPRSATGTRAVIRDAARSQFASNGYERTTIRAVASAADVDPALVMRYFDNKAGLFAAASDLDLDLPSLVGLAPDEIGRALVGRFFEVWEEDGTFLALLRGAVTSDEALARMREVFATQVAPVLAEAAVDHPSERAALVAAQVLGFALVRDIVGLPPAAGMTRDDVHAWLGATLAHLLTGPAPG